MATIGASYVTLLDWAKRKDPDGKTSQIIELLATSNPVIKDAATIEGNLPTGNMTTTRTGLPSGAWRKLNYGVQPSKSTTVQVTDQAGTYEAYSKIDCKIADLASDARAFRKSEDVAFTETFNQQVASTIFYGDTSLYPERFLGLSPRYSDSTAANAANIIDGGGTGSTNTSMWLVKWGEQTCHLFFPKGSKAGLVMEDLGRRLEDDDQTPPGKYMAYVTRFVWDLGLSLRDWRNVVRVANIETGVTGLSDDADTGVDLIRKAIKGWYLRPQTSFTNKSNTFWYCNTKVAEYLHVQALNKPNVDLNLKNVEGEPVTTLFGCPVHVCEALVNTEAAVTGL